MNTWIWDVGSAVAMLVFMALVSHWVQGKRYTATKCGHDTYLFGGAMVLGETPFFKLPLVNDAPEYCIDCVAAMSIRCAWCGQPIHAGDQVTLYPSREGMEVHPKAMLYQEDEEDPYRRYVGCVRGGCAKTLADRAGTWVPPRLVQLLPTEPAPSFADLSRT